MPASLVRIAGVSLKRSSTIFFTSSPVSGLMSRLAFLASAMKFRVGQGFGEGAAQNLQPILRRARRGDIDAHDGRRIDGAGFQQLPRFIGFRQVERHRHIGQLGDFFCGNLQHDVDLTGRESLCSMRLSRSPKPSRRRAIRRRPPRGEFRWCLCSLRRAGSAG